MTKLTMGAAILGLMVIGSMLPNLESVSVKANDAVGRNQVIGNLPSTANNDDWYLHFELWKGTTFLNPEKWLPR